MTHNIAVWFEIYVKDMDRALKFYKEVFQVEITRMDVPSEVDAEMYSFPMDESMSTFGAPGALVKMKGYEPSGMGTIVYFVSKDCAIEEARIEKAGGKVLTPKTGIDQYGYMCLFTDTEGNTVGIHSME